MPSYNIRVNGAVRNVDAWYAAFNVQPGDKLYLAPEQRVIISLPDGPDYVAALFGVLKIGAVVVMVNPELKSEAIEYFFDYSRAAVALVVADGGPRVDVGASFDDLREGQRVSFTIGQGPKGPRAENVRPE